MSTSQSRFLKKPASVRHLTVNTNVPEVEGPRSSKARSPFCGVCFKAKQPATIYNSHWTRMNPNPKSPITCPLILQTVCNYCKNKGHSVKYCPVAAKKEDRRRRRASSVSSNASSHAESCVSISSSPALEKGSWLQAAMKSESSEPKPVLQKTLSLENPSDLNNPDPLPSPPKLQRTRRTWDWNADFDSDND